MGPKLKQSAKSVQKCESKRLANEKNHLHIYVEVFENLETKNDVLEALVKTEALMKNMIKYDNFCQQLDFKKILNKRQKLAKRIKNEISLQKQTNV